MDIHMDLATPRWRISTPFHTSEPFSGISEAGREAIRLLRRKGYEDISAPAP